MGRWAQAQRRGTATEAAPAFPIPAPDDGSFQVEYDDPADAGIFELLDTPPAGADGIRWAVGEVPLSEDAFGVHTGFANFSVPNTAGEATTMWAFFWYTLAGVQVSFPSVAKAWQSV